MQQSLNNQLLLNLSRPELLTKLIEAGADNFNNAFMQAVLSQEAAAIEILKTRVSPEYGLRIATLINSEELVDYFMKTATNIVECYKLAETSGKSVVEILCKHEDTAFLCAFIDGHDLTGLTGDWNEALRFAVEMDRVESVRLAVENGANTICEALKIARSSEIIEYLVDNRDKDACC